MNTSGESSLCFKPMEPALKHLNTREFKQQEALHKLEREEENVKAEIERKQREESELQERLQLVEHQAQEAEKILSAQLEIPKSSMFNHKAVRKTTDEIIERQKQTLADRSISTAKNQRQETKIQGLKKTVSALNDQVMNLTVDKAQEQKRHAASLTKLMDENHNLSTCIEEIEKFFRWNQEANQMHLDYKQEQRKEAERKAAEQRRLPKSRRSSRSANDRKNYNIAKTYKIWGVFQFLSFYMPNIFDDIIIAI